MIIFVILILTFASVTLLINEFIPLSTIWAKLWQTKTTKNTVQGLDRMFYRIPRKKIILMVTLFPLGLGLIGLLFTHHILGIIIGMSIGAFIPRLFIKYMEKKRKQKFAEQLVDGLMIISSSLKAGLSLLQSIETMVEEMPPPINQEFGLLVNENHMGIPFEECAEHLKQRVDCEDLDMIITAILVARETGGDLTETFSQLVYTIREKDKIDRRVRTLTTQGKLQGAIMALLPIVFAIFVYKMNPNSFDIMLKDSVGKMLLVWAVVSQIIGILLIKKLSKVDF